MTENSLDWKNRLKAVAPSVDAGGISLGTHYGQKFYAIRADGGSLRFPFAAQPFTALVDIAGEVSETALRGYARELIGHGCVQAVCRGGDSGLMNDIFGELADNGETDNGDFPFTSMALDDEPLNEAIEYFILPNGLAATGLVMVIGDSGAFRSAIDSFTASTSGAKEAALGIPVYVEEELVCFDPVQC